MTKSPGKLLGCSIAFLLIAIPAMYLFGLGWVRTIAPVAAPLASGNLLIQLEATDFEETIDLWPIVSTVTYPNTGPIRGKMRNSAGGDRRTDYKITISSQRGGAREVRCHRDYRDACYFDADLGQTDLTEGVLISVVDANDGQTLVPHRLVNFRRISTYSLALWDALMSV
ncbi:hypothetical protein [Edaphosphingomonas haloaromaticamans]|uniref:hypothetical protein n=1 Tax=Edaphosphingomonas haloaromaticamans TaxID=653954 RepID=UPI001113398C|nr:hypothetical protein [Sphingomonas haloaromaticamans]